MKSLTNTFGFAVSKAVSAFVKEADNGTFHDQVSLMEYINIQEYKEDKCQLNNLFVIRNGYIHVVSKNIEVDQFSQTHEGYLEFLCGFSKPEDYTFVLVEKSYDYAYASEITKEKAIELMRQWDSEAVKIVAPDNNGVFLSIPKELHGLMAEVMLSARENGSIRTLVSSIKRLVMNKEANHRVRFHYICKEEIGFVMEYINRQGEWKKVFNGGIVLHSDNRWSTHT